MSLARKAAGSTIWVGITTYANQLITFLASIVLMRLIAPEAFGVLALAIFLCTLARKLVAFGYNHALIHKLDDLPTAAGTHLTLHIFSGLLVVFGVLAAYPVVAASYDKLTAAVLIGVSIGALWESAGNTPRILLEKEVEFRRIQLMNFTVNTGINLFAVLGALLWPNVWLLLFRLIGAQAASAISYWWLNPRFERTRPTWAMVKWYLRFGAPLWVGGLATFAVLQFDDFLVGTLIDAEQLGYYTRAYALAVLPTTMVTHIVARVAFPLYSKVQHNREKLSEAFGTVMRMIVLLSAPMAVGLAFCAQEFVGVIYGDTWRPMAVLLQLLLIYEVLRPMFDDVGELFTAIGQPRKIGRIQVFQAIAMVVVATPLVWGFAAKGAAISAGLVMIVGVAMAYRDLRAHVTLDVRGIFLVPVAVCLVAAGVSATILWRWPVTSEPLRLLAKIGLFGGWTVVLFALVQGRRMYAEMQQMRERLREK